MKEMLTELFQPIILALITAGVAAVMAYIRKKLKDEKHKAILNEVEACLLEGMAQAQEQIVRPAKKDGQKLDNEAIAAAESMAIKYAKASAKGAVLSKLKDLSGSRLKSMIKGLLRK